ncbi:hypothetical protein P7K49_018910 [Saguinus oedipus]|uniref:Uncharacterized protein n=1 Tax=Saguinus oedipus TaxID=9490 RepID=A0ABQ9UWS6_SAGOE|nr:hypothetical protein P7K49_018910 [Saguinus oedipus]
MRATRQTALTHSCVNVPQEFTAQPGTQSPPFPLQTSVAISKRNTMPWVPGLDSPLPHPAASFAVCPPSSQTSYLQLTGSHFEGEVGDTASGPAGCIGGMQLIPDGVSVHLREPESGPVSSKASHRSQGPRGSPPHGQDPRGRELDRQRCLPSAPPPKGKASCVPQSQHDFFPA